LIPAANWAVDSTGTSGTTWSVTVPSGNGTATVDQTQVFQGILQTSGSQTGIVMQPEACWPNPGSDYPWHDSTLAHPSPYNQVGDWSYVVGSEKLMGSSVDAGCKVKHIFRIRPETCKVGMKSGRNDACTFEASEFTNNRF